MNKVYKLLGLTAAILCCSSGFAESNDSEELANNCPPKSCKQVPCMKKQAAVEPFEQGMELPCGKYPCAYNAPAAICLKNAWDFNVAASFIYWHASQDDMDIAYVQPVFGVPGTAGAVAYQDFNFEPGFKVAAGWDTDYDGWTFKAEYTWLHETVSTGAISAPVVAGWSGNDWFSNPGVAPAMASSWNLKLDMVDAVMARPFYEGRKLTVTPFGGLRGLWLRQKMNVTPLDAAGAVVASSNNRSTSWAVGPATGVGGHWLLGAGFRFEGNATASILYTHYNKISVRETSPGFAALSSSVKDISAVRPIGQLNLGLGWGMYFHGCNSDCYLDISVDYEFANFWSQNMMRSFDSNLLGYADDIGDLQIHGLTATVRFDF